MPGVTYDPTPLRINSAYKDSTIVKDDDGKFVVASSKIAPYSPLIAKTINDINSRISVISRLSNKYKK